MSKPSIQNLPPHPLLGGITNNEDKIEKTKDALYIFSLFYGIFNLVYYFILLVKKNPSSSDTEEEKKKKENYPSLYYGIVFMLCFLIFATSQKIPVVISLFISLIILILSLYYSVKIWNAGATYAVPSNIITIGSFIFLGFMTMKKK